MPQGGNMKMNSRLAILVLLGLVLGCARFGQRSQSNSQSNGAQTKASPAGTPGVQALPKTSGERGTPDEAKAMLTKAIEHYNSVGRKQALADFTGKKAPFSDRDLYVACIAPDHIIVANGGFPKLVGSSVDAWKDAEGKSVGKASFDAVSSTGEGSVRYRWFNPVSNKIEPKVLYVQKVGEDICGVGAYNPE